MYLFVRVIEFATFQRFFYFRGVPIVWYFCVFPFITTYHIGIDLEELL